MSQALSKTRTGRELPTICLRHIACPFTRSFIRLDKLRIFEITEAELEALERGSPESVFLNLAVAVLSIAISFSVALATTKIDNDRTFYVFVIVTSVGYVAGVTFGLLWFISRRSLKNVSAEIRSRIPPEGVQENGGDAPNESHNKP